MGKNNLNANYMNLVGHELRTPLVPLFGYLNMVLEEKGLNRDIRKKLKICLKSVNKELAIIQDIIDNSKLEAGTLSFDVEEIDINCFLKDVGKKIKPIMAKEKLYLRYNIPLKLPHIKGDVIRLKQVVINLINNAIRLTEHGGITLMAREKAKNIELSITDTGVGLKKKDLKNIFNKFYKFNLANDKKDPGTGIEMTICRQIIRWHKGKIWLKNMPGKGTTAYFTIPTIK